MAAVDTSTQAENADRLREALADGFANEIADCVLGNPTLEALSEDDRDQIASDIQIEAIRVLRKALADAIEAQSVRDVLAERRRQVEAEGWTPEHDDDCHDHGQLARAAACYACPDDISWTDYFGLRWPWSREWWKPKDRRRNLVRAGALILAEIDRLDRAREAVSPAAPAQG